MSKPFFIWSSICLLVQRADAYVGPGAGFVLASGFWTLAALVLAALAILVLPVRLLLGWRRGKKIAARASAERVVVIGLDGLDPQLVARWMEEGRLPAFKKLAEQGTFRPLQTTLPAITPAAWSAFATGVDASRHRIYDFITRDPHTYQPVLSSARISASRRSLGLGPYRLPLEQSAGAQFAAEPAFLEGAGRQPRLQFHRPGAHQFSPRKIRGAPARGHERARSARHPRRVYLFF